MRNINDIFRESKFSVDNQMFLQNLTSDKALSSNTQELLIDKSSPYSHPCVKQFITDFNIDVSKQYTASQNFINDNFGGTTIDNKTNMTYGGYKDNYDSTQINNIFTKDIAGQRLGEKLQENAVPIIVLEAKKDSAIIQVKDVKTNQTQIFGIVKNPEWKPGSNKPKFIYTTPNKMPTSIVDPEKFRKTINKNKLSNMRLQMGKRSVGTIAMGSLAMGKQGYHSGLNIGKKAISTLSRGSEESQIAGKAVNKFVTASNKLVTAGNKLTTKTVKAAHKTIKLPKKIKRMVGKVKRTILNIKKVAAKTVRFSKRIIKTVWKAMKAVAKAIRIVIQTIFRVLASLGPYGMMIAAVLLICCVFAFNIIELEEEADSGSNTGATQELAINGSMEEEPINFGQLIVYCLEDFIAEDYNAIAQRANNEYLEGISDSLVRHEVYGNDEYLAIFNIPQRATSGNFYVWEQSDNTSRWVVGLKPEILEKHGITSGKEYSVSENLIDDYKFFNSTYLTIMDSGVSYKVGYLPGGTLSPFTYGNGLFTKKAYTGCNMNGYGYVDAYGYYYDDNNDDGIPEQSLRKCSLAYIADGVNPGISSPYYISGFNSTEQDTFITSTYYNSGMNAYRYTYSGEDSENKYGETREWYRLFDEQRDIVSAYYNIPTIYSMMNYRIRTDKNIDNWKNSLAYCYYMYVVSHQMDNKDSKKIFNIEGVDLSYFEGDNYTVRTSTDNYTIDFDYITGKQLLSSVPNVYDSTANKAEAREKPASDGTLYIEYLNGVLAGSLAKRNVKYCSDYMLCDDYYHTAGRNDGSNDFMTYSINNYHFIDSSEYLFYGNIGDDYVSFNEDADKQKWVLNTDIMSGVSFETIATTHSSVYETIKGLDNVLRYRVIDNAYRSTTKSDITADCWVTDTNNPLCPDAYLYIKQVDSPEECTFSCSRPKYETELDPDTNQVVYVLDENGDKIVEVDENGNEVNVTAYYKMFLVCPGHPQGMISGSKNMAMVEMCSYEGLMHLDNYVQNVDLSLNDIMGSDEWTIDEDLYESDLNQLIEDLQTYGSDIDLDSEESDIYISYLENWQNKLYTFANHQALNRFTFVKNAQDMLPSSRYTRGQIYLDTSDNDFKNDELSTIEQFTGWFVLNNDGFPVMYKNLFLSELYNDYGKPLLPNGSINKDYINDITGMYMQKNVYFDNSLMSVTLSDMSLNSQRD